MLVAVGPLTQHGHSLQIFPQHQHGIQDSHYSVQMACQVTDRYLFLKL